MELSDTVLLIDVRNALYRAIYAGKAERVRNPRKDNYHFITFLLRQYSYWMRTYNPKSIHIFWDAPRETVWRRIIHPTYKDRTQSSYVEDISEDLAETTVIAKELFAVLGMRQYEAPRMEADDLIYAAASVMYPQKMVIVSSDSDMIQIPYRYHNCVVFNPHHNREEALPVCCPCLVKALAGDTSDNIEGYYGIGPVKGANMAKSPKALHDYVTTHGRKKLNVNLLLIDLSVCPYLLPNKVTIMKGMVKPVVFDKPSIMGLVEKYKINGIQQEWHDIVAPCSRLT